MLDTVKLFAQYLAEKLTFDQFFKVSDPKRIARSHTVHYPPVEIEAGQDSTFYYFNFKSNPSTTGLRHRGYIRFFKPQRGNLNKPLQHVDCLVECSCPDFKYRWAWANKQRGSSRVGPDSLTGCWNKAPRKTNPKSVPGLCKHLLSARSTLYGLLSAFPKGAPDTVEKLDKITRMSKKRWADYSGEMAKAREREAKFAAARDARNRGEPPPTDSDTTSVTKKYQTLTPPPLPPELPEPPASEMSKIAPPSQRGRQLPIPPESEMAKTPPPGQRGRQLPAAPKPSTPPAKPPGKPGKKNPKTESVIKDAETKYMNAELTEALKLVEELEHDELEKDTMSDAALEPSEPPISDQAIGADTEGETVLSLLRQIKDFLGKLATALAPEDEESPEAEEGAAEPVGDEEGFIPEPGEGEGEGSGFEDDGEEEEDREHEIADRRPEPIA